MTNKVRGEDLATIIVRHNMEHKELSVFLTKEIDEAEKRGEKEYKEYIGRFN